VDKYQHISKLLSADEGMQKVQVCQARSYSVVETKKTDFMIWGYLWVVNDTDIPHQRL